MNYSNPTLASSLGLLAEPKDQTPQMVNALRYREAQKAAKIKAEDDDFQKMLGVVNIDYSKYHRIDRDRVKEMTAGWLANAYKEYQTKDPAWRTKVAMSGQELKFNIEQALVDSAEKFKLEKYYEDPTTLKTPELTNLYNWYREGDRNRPPEIQADQFGQVTAFDPLTGTAGFVPAKQVNLPQFFDKTIYEPALSGYAIKPDEYKYAGKDRFVREYAQYTPEMVKAGIYATAGSPEFNSWRLMNSQRLREAAAANPTEDPNRIAMQLWEQDGLALQPNKFNEVRVSPEDAPTNIYNAPVEAKKETLYSNWSNLGTKEISDPNKPVSFDNFTKVAGGKIIYREEGGKKTTDPMKVELKVPSALTNKTIEFAPNRAMTGAGKPLAERTQGKMAKQEFFWGTMGTDGQIDIKSEAEYNNLPPEERAKVKPFIRVFFEETEGGTAVGEVPTYPPSPQTGGTLTGRTFYVNYNIAQGSPDVDELNNIDQGLTVTAKQKTEQGTGEPGAYETNKKYEGQVTPTTPKTEKMLWPEWKAKNPKGTITEFNNYRSQ